MENKPAPVLRSIADLKNFDKSLLANVTIVNRIEAFLEDMNLTPTKMVGDIVLGDSSRRTHVFHASSIGSNTGSSLCGKYTMGCGRMLYYTYIGAPSESSWEPRMRRILDTGTGIHKQLQLYIHEHANRTNGEEEFEDEADINPDTNTVADQLDISAHVDGIYQIHVPAEIQFGLEIKSINDAGYKKTSGIHPEHSIQGTVYQACLDLPVMLFLYYNKNDSSMAEFVQTFDKFKWAAIEAKLNMVREHALSNTEPPQESSYACHNCKYKKVCNPPKKLSGAVGRQFMAKQLKEE